MLVLEEKKIIIPDNHFPKSSSFVIERVVVPDNLKDIMITVNTQDQCIKLALVYDSNYNLRAEINKIHQKREIKISTSESLTSIGAKAGIIPAGEWIIAFEVDREVSNNSMCLLTVLGNK